MAAEKAKEQGRKSVYFTDREGAVTECARTATATSLRTANLITAPTDNLILPGIVRAHLIKAW